MKNYVLVGKMFSCGNFFKIIPGNVSTVFTFFRTQSPFPFANIYFCCILLCHTGLNKLYFPCDKQLGHGCSKWTFLIWQSFFLLYEGNHKIKFISASIHAPDSSLNNRMWKGRGYDFNKKKSLSTQFQYKMGKIPRKN